MKAAAPGPPTSGVLTYPILMSAPMVRALLEGRKTQSRRIPTRTWERVYRALHAGQAVRLWVREGGIFGSSAGVYRADLGTEEGGCAAPKGWTPSIHMPRHASRRTLIVTAARRQRLREISREDCRAEGALPSGSHGWHEGFRDIWNGLHRRSGERWEDNPEVIALSFSVHRGNIDRLAG